MANSETRGDVQEAQPAEEHAYRPKPPLWRPARERRRSAAEIVLTAVGITAVSLILGIFVFEGHLLSTPATAMAVTITAIESASHADEEPAGSITYRVSLADGSQARFTSSRSYAVGTRLVAMVARGRLTGRIIVTAPYGVLPNK